MNVLNYISKYFYGIGIKQKSFYVTTAPQYANKVEPVFVCFFFYHLFAGIEQGNPKYLGLPYFLLFGYFIF